MRRSAASPAYWSHPLHQTSSATMCYDRVPVKQGSPGLGLGDATARAPDGEAVRGLAATARLGANDRHHDRERAAHAVRPEQRANVCVRPDRVVGVDLERERAELEEAGNAVRVFTCQTGAEAVLQEPAAANTSRKVEERRIAVDLRVDLVEEGLWPSPPSLRSTPSGRPSEPETLKGRTGTGLPAHRGSPLNPDCWLPASCTSSCVRCVTNVRFGLAAIAGVVTTATRASAASAAMNRRIEHPPRTKRRPAGQFALREWRRRADSNR